MTIGVPKETKLNENRVALSPEVVRQLTKTGFKVLIEKNAGAGAHFADIQYEQAGALIAESAQTLYAQADVVCKVNAPTADEARLFKEGATYLGFLYAYTIPEVVNIMAERKITAFAMDAVPRISRAQKMDALSSQANLAGYKAVILGANALGKIFPLMMTAAGSITPARVLIFGAGVAGLQAIATARRLGAVVECTDVRPETKEQVESLGGRFLEVKTEGEQVKTAGGYAAEVSEEYLKKQKELIAKHVSEADIVITTALVMGKKAPILVTEDMVKTMKPGSVIVDMAVESGGNCALSEINKTVIKHGVTIIGEANLPSTLAVNASELYARNLSTLLLHLCKPSEWIYDMNEEITKGCMILHQGTLVHEFTKKILNPTA